MKLIIGFRNYANALTKLQFQRVEERPPIRKVATNILKKAVSDSREEVVLQLGDWAWSQQLLTVKT
jgi:hypothetical protein